MARHIFTKVVTNVQGWHEISEDVKIFARVITHLRM